MKRRVITATNVLFHQFGSEAVLLNITNETYYRLDPVALDMWQALTNSASVDEAKTQLIAMYDADPAVIEADLNEFMDRLQKSQLIEVQE